MAESIESRIAEVILAHTPSGAEGLVNCYCGERFDSFASHAAHVASVVAALLRAEWTWSWPNGSGQGVPGFGYTVDTRGEAVDECDNVPYTIVRRWVTPWEPA